MEYIPDDIDNWYCKTTTSAVIKAIMAIIIIIIIIIMIIIIATFYIHNISSKMSIDYKVKRSII